MLLLVFKHNQTAFRQNKDIYLSMVDVEGKQMYKWLENMVSRVSKEHESCGLVKAKHSIVSFSGELNKLYHRTIE